MALEIVVLLQDFHRDAVAEVVGFSSGSRSSGPYTLQRHQTFLPVFGALVLPTPRRPQLDQNSRVSGSAKRRAADGAAR